MKDCENATSIDFEGYKQIIVSRQILKYRSHE